MSFIQTTVLPGGRTIKTRFPLLALRFLGPPPTSVPSECLFSGAGDIFDKKCSRFNPEKAEIHLFIKNNFELVAM